MPSVAVKENHLTYNGKKYFRGGAEDVMLGALGEKRTPLFGQNYLEVKDQILVPAAAKVEVTEVSIDFTATSKTDFKTDVSVEGIPGKLSGGVVFEKLRSGELVLLKLSVLPNTMMGLLGGDYAKMVMMYDWGNDARVAHQIFVVVRAELRNVYNNSQNLSVTANVDGITLSPTLTTSQTGSQRVVVSKNSVFAYLLAKVEWDKKEARHGRKKIVTLNDDQWGMS
ncbi:hypothetical protein [Zoogloea sp.]|uniref:hypothetical protein n=1 Tax=Zoogloea sp. TaxID=49181 RepID=UPI0035AE0880